MKEITFKALDDGEDRDGYIIKGMESYLRTFSELTNEELYDIAKVRFQVFVMEQKIYYPDLDDLDQVSHHLFIKEDGKIIAYLRILPPGKEYPEPALGRVLTLRRGVGLGKKIIQEGIEAAIRLYRPSVIKVEAQKQAKGFYEKCGFTDDGKGIFLDAGIEHLEMSYRVQ